MNNDQFNEWLMYHGRLFSNFDEWVAKQHDDLIRLWRRSLSNADFEICKQISEDMATGRVEQPAGYGKHINIVVREEWGRRRSSSAGQQRYVEGQRVYDCSDCRDFGVVLIYHPDFLGAISGRELTLEQAERLIHVCNASCPCAAGDRWREVRPPRKPLTTYSAGAKMWTADGKAVPMTRVTRDDWSGRAAEAVEAVTTEWM
jgi:hypothetical protein